MLMPYRSCSAAQSFRRLDASLVECASESFDNCPLNVWVKLPIIAQLAGDFLRCAHHDFLPAASPSTNRIGIYPRPDPALAGAGR